MKVLKDLCSLMIAIEIGRPTSATGSHRSLPFSKILNSNIFVAPKEKYGDASSLLFLLLLLLSVPLSCLSIPMLLLVSTAGF